MGQITKLKIRDKEKDLNWYVAKRVLKTHNVTYKQMSELLNCSVTAVHDMLNHPPSIVHVKLMADAIGCSFYDFFDFSASPTESVKCPAVAPHGELTCPNCGQQFLLTPANPEPTKE